MKNTIFAAVASIVTCIASVGCATGGGGGNDDGRRLAAMAALIALDLDALQDGDATLEEKARFQKDVERVIAYVGVDSEIGGVIAGLLTEYISSGNLDDKAWREVVRVLLEGWAE